MRGRYLAKASSFTVESRPLCCSRGGGGGISRGRGRDSAVVVVLRTHEAALLVFGCLLLHLPVLLFGVPAVKEAISGSSQLVAGTITVAFAIDRV